jgi:hypothetical protein
LRTGAKAGEAETGDALQVASDEVPSAGHVRLSVSAHPAPSKRGSLKKQEKPGKEEKILEMAGTSRALRRGRLIKVDLCGGAQRTALFLGALRIPVYPPPGEPALSEEGAEDGYRNALEGHELQ